MAEFIQRWKKVQMCCSYATLVLLVLCRPFHCREILGQGGVGLLIFRKWAHSFMGGAVQPLSTGKLNFLKRKRIKALINHMGCSTCYK